MQMAFLTEGAHYSKIILLLLLLCLFFPGCCCIPFHIPAQKSYAAVLVKIHFRIGTYYSPEDYVLKRLWLLFLGSLGSYDYLYSLPWFI